MFLEKWYGDFIENGQAHIRYRANLKLGPFSIGYTGFLQQGQTGTSDIALGHVSLPSIRDGNLHWPIANNGSAIIWHGAKLRQQQLLNERGRLLTWDPVILNSEVAVDGVKCARRGYAERLTINFAPWHLGMKGLKWGRFCGKKNSLVWIEWAGKLHKKFALLNGGAVSLLEANRDAVIAENARLTFDAPSEIVSERLESGALKALGFLRMFAAQRFLAGIETKWIAEACLEMPGEAADQGYAIYEEVVWP